MVYVLVGPPGAGKGTQAALLAASLGLPHVATGDLFRTALKLESPLGHEVKSYLDRGALVPDDVVTRMVAERLAMPDAADGAVLDGFPRTRPQAVTLDVLLRKRGGRVAAALYIHVSREELLRRLSGRWVCAAAEHVYHEESNPPRVRGVCDIDGSELYQRDDDRPETVRQRLQRQLAPMHEVVDHYTERGVLFGVNGEASIDAVSEALQRAIAPPARAR